MLKLFCNRSITTFVLYTADTFTFKKPFYDCLRVSRERGRRLSQGVGGGVGGSKAACEAKLEAKHHLPKFFYITEQFL